MNKNKRRNYIILMFNIAVSMVHTCDALAASITNKNQHHVNSSIKKNNYDDVWERIRLGMNITAPGLTPSKPAIIPEPPKPKYLIQPHTAVAPLNNYTELGFRLKFGSAPASSPQNNCTDDLSAQNATPCEKPAASLNISAKQHNIAEKNNKKKTINGRVDKYIAFFTEHPEYLYRMTERAHPYLYHIVEALSKNQLPLELALLPMVESAYQPTALSPKGAAGLWQFISSTGKDYDLKQSNQYDERLDIVASTQAAIRYLSDLKSHFNGDWLLALAAYNCGQGAVDNAISRNIADGLATDFWSLRLPEETQEYVPRLLALSHIFANPAVYGLKFTPVKNEPYFVKIKIDREPDIKYLANKNFALLAKLVNLSHEQFKSLNPGYLNPTLSSGKEYTFLLPLKNVDQLHRLLTSITQFMAEPVSQTMKEAVKQTPPAITDLTSEMMTTL